jgi:hypothetical protein
LSDAARLYARLQQLAVPAGVEGEAQSKELELPAVERDPGAIGSVAAEHTPASFVVGNELQSESTEYLRQRIPSARVAEQGAHQHSAPACRLLERGALGGTTIPTGQFEEV